MTPAAQGDYECIGSNKYGTAQGSTRLVVRSSYLKLYHKILNFSEPTRLEPFAATDLSMTAGKTIVLDCDAKADQALDVNYEWLIDNKPLPQGQIDSGIHKISRFIFKFIFQDITPSLRTIL